MKGKVQSKLCIRCNKVLPLDSFYSNKLWSAQKYHDSWCKNCAMQYCQDAETVKEYCYENNRVWEDVFWESAVKKAQYVLATDPEYISPRVSDKKKRELETKTAARQFFCLMNLKRFYHYVDNMKEDSEDTSKDELVGNVSHKRSYNRKWGGFFTQEEIEA